MWHIRLLRLSSLLFIGIGVFVLAIGLKFFQQRWSLPLQTPVDEQWLSALATLPQIFTAPDEKTSSGKIVYGFLPYWTAKDATLHQELTHVGYFGLPIDKNGNFIDSNDEGSMGWKTYHAIAAERVRQQTSLQRQKFEVLITMMDADDIATFLLNNKAQETFIKNMKQLLKSQPIDGVNIDIEYAGTYDPSLRDAYTKLIKNLSLSSNDLIPHFTFLSMSLLTAHSNNAFGIFQHSPPISIILSL
jgi:hypothetical protein